VGCSNKTDDVMKRGVSVEVSSRFTKQDTHNRKELTAFDGDPVGASVGLRGALEGEWLGLDVGCNKTEDNYEEKSE